MSSRIDLAITTISNFADQGAVVLRQNREIIRDALQTIASGALTPEVTYCLKDKLTLIELQIQDEACLQTIQKIKSAFFPLEQILDVLFDTPQEAITLLQQKSYITLDEATGTLSFSGKLVGKLQPTLFEYLLQNMSVEYRANVRVFPLRDFPVLGVDAPALLVKYCPNLSFDSFEDLPKAFFDHTICTKEGRRVRVNRALLMEISPYFKRLWQGGMKEAQGKDEGVTVLQDLDHTQFKIFLELLHGEKVRLRDINTLASMAEFFDHYGLLDCRELEQRYMDCMKRAFTYYKEELHDRDAILGLIRNFQPFFNRGSFLSLREPIATLACPLPRSAAQDVEAFLTNYQEILTFMISTFESDFARYAIPLLVNHLPHTHPRERSQFQEAIDEVLRGRWGSYEMTWGSKKYIEPIPTLATMFQYVKDRALLQLECAQIEDLLLQHIDRLYRAECFEFMLKFNTLLAAIPCKRSLHLGLQFAVIPILRPYLTQEADTDEWSRLLALPYVQEHILQIAGFEHCGHGNFLSMFYYKTDPEKHVDKALSFIDFCESISPERSSRAALQCNFARAAFLRLHPDPAMREQAFVLYSEISQTEDREMQARARHHLIDIRRARGEREGLIEELEALIDGLATNPEWKYVLSLKQYHNILCHLEGRPITDRYRFTGNKNFEEFLSGTRRLKDTQSPWKLGPFLSLIQEDL